MTIRCRGCGGSSKKPKYLVKLDHDTIAKVTYDDKVIFTPVCDRGVFPVCGIKCVSLLMLDILTSRKGKKDEE